MAKVVTPVTAKVEVIGKLKESAYQEGQYYRSVLFLDLSQLGGSDEAKIWKSLSEAECDGLVKGATVQLVPAGRDKNGNDKHNIVLLEGDRPITPTATTTAVPSNTEWTMEQKKVIASKV